MSGGGLLQYASQTELPRFSERAPVLITGGAGFIGTNLADRLMTGGERVLLFDNLSRVGVERNLAWLRQKHGPMAEFVRADTRDAAAVNEAVQRASAVFHFAAQVAVTDSLANPVNDFAVNAHGTLNVLEAIRNSRHKPDLLFTSTNKVYGDLGSVAIRQAGARYEAVDSRIARHGVSEDVPLSFQSPYGCSKGSADQYVLDYARCFGLRAVVFRMSCIYGPHQFGTEDQGWVAHFLIRALNRERITLYGDGMQVRDLLFVEDLVNAFLLARQHITSTTGKAFNIGGGPANAVSLLDLLALMAHLNGDKPDVAYEDWRTGDQKYYVSDTRRFQAVTGWGPLVDVQQGVQSLRSWLLDATPDAAYGPIIQQSAAS
jgi:CDP-paratose 2-epimerase